MLAATYIAPETGQRQSRRTAHETPVRFQCGKDDEGTAICRELSPGGMRLHLNRYFRPGQHLLLNLSKSTDMKARVIWCRPMAADPGRFEMGIKVYHDAPDTQEAMAIAFDGAEFDSYETDTWSPLAAAVEKIFSKRMTVASVTMTATFA